MGGEQIDCPSCSGTGYIAIPDYVQKAKETEPSVLIKKRKKKETIEDAEADQSISENKKEECREELHA
jgi:hypothetical protein